MRERLGHRERERERARVRGGGAGRQGERREYGAQSATAARLLGFGFRL
jgi:hypothetical protein